MCDIQKWIKKHIDVFKLIFIFPLFLGDQIFMQDSKLKCLQNKLRKEAFKLREKITIIQYGMS